ncbi:hypothetical protein GCM10027447_07820 [Glycomyces halotolerans]
MTAIEGFWSYAHADDEAESGRIAQLARDVRSQFEMLTGESIKLFLDRDELEWGNDWQREIDSSLATIAFFVPVITPRYFRSEQCRRELHFFGRKTERLGLEELVLPLLWVDFPGLREEDPADELITLVSRFQWSDWTEHRFADIESGQYRKAVGELAKRLVLANAAAEKSTATIALEGLEIDGQDEPGALDKLGSMEESFPQMTTILLGAADAIQEIGELVREATAEIGSNTNPKAVLATRLRVARGLASSLSEPSGQIRSLGNDFSSSLNEVDEGVRLIIERAPEEANKNPEATEQFLSFFQALRDMMIQAEAGLGAVANMIEKIEPVEKLSRDLRKPLRTLREGLTLFVDGLAVMRGWISLIETVEPEVASGSSSPDPDLPAA